MALPAALAIGGFALNVLGSFEQASNAKKVYNFQRRLQIINQRIAAEQADRSINQIRARQVQERAALSEQVIAISDQARAALAVSSVQSAESGTAGSSLLALQDDFERQEAKSQQALIRSQQFRDQQADAQAAQVRTGQRTNELNSLPDPLQLPRLLGTLGGAASQALQIYTAAEGTFGSSQSSSASPPPAPPPPVLRIPSSPVGDFPTSIALQDGTSLA